MWRSRFAATVGSSSRRRSIPPGYASVGSRAGGLSNRPSPVVHRPRDEHLDLPTLPRMPQGPLVVEPLDFAAASAVFGRLGYRVWGDACAGVSQPGMAGDDPI